MWKKKWRVSLHLGTGVSPLAVAVCRQWSMQLLWSYPQVIVHSGICGIHFYIMNNIQYIANNNTPLKKFDDSVTQRAV